MLVKTVFLIQRRITAMSANKPRSEAWVKKEVKKIFAEFGCPNPYMPAAAIYGKAGGADFIECMFYHYIAVETKKIGNKLTPLQRKFGQGIAKRGGHYLVVYEYNLIMLRSLFLKWQEEASRICV